MNVKEKWIEICSRIRELDRLRDEATDEYFVALKVQGTKLSSVTGTAYTS